MPDPEVGILCKKMSAKAIWSKLFKRNKKIADSLGGGVVGATTDENRYVSSSSCALTEPPTKSHPLPVVSGWLHWEDGNMDGYIHLFSNPESGTRHNYNENASPI